MRAGELADAPGALDPTTLVVAHSWSGHTDRLANEIGATLAAHVIVFHDPPMPDLAHGEPTLEAIQDTISLRGVRTMYIGFPVWGEAPSPPIMRLVSRLSLSGVRVVPFYSYIHYLRPAALESFRRTIRARGGTLVPELPFLIPLSTTDSDLAARARRALFSRSDLLPATDETLTPSCGERNATDGVSLCRVSAGLAWTGDGAPNPPEGALPPRLARVNALLVDRTEITVGQYEQCQTAGACAAIDYGDSFCQDLLHDRPDRAMLPLPCATFTNAEAYCRWAHMRLPTEAEWIRAARGSTLHAFPWGDEFSSAAALRGNFGEKPSTGFVDYSTVAEDRDWPSDGFRGLAPPCSFPAGASPFGLCDMAGNVAEWVRAEGRYFVKGGSWLDGESSALRVGSRAELPDVFARRIPIYVTGFRCVRDAN